MVRGRGALRAPVRVRRGEVLGHAEVVAVEDRRFREHPGVDPIGIARSPAGNDVSGGAGGIIVPVDLPRVSVTCCSVTVLRVAR